MKPIEFFINISATCLEIVGTSAILISSLYTIILLTRYKRKEFITRQFYKSFRHHLGHGILIGLEFLIAADIIRSVAIKPTLDNLVVLVGIVVVRTFLSITLELEISRKWPWQSEK